LTLTTTEFHARVHALNPRIAVFDCDGTLWSGDAGSTFMRWTMGELDAPALLAPDRIAWLDERYEGYKRGEVSELAICGEMVQVYAGIRIETLRAAAAEFFRTHIEHRIFSEMRQLVTELQSSGCEIWAVSSTCDWVIEEGVRRFNIPADRVLAARVAPKDCLATTMLLDVPTDQGKVTARCCHAIHRAQPAGNQRSIPRQPVRGPGSPRRRRRLAHLLPGHCPIHRGRHRVALSGP
jgi:phosphoserine phosphatase